MTSCKNGHLRHEGRACRECQKLAGSRYRHKHPEEKREHVRTSRLKIRTEDPARLLMYSVKGRVNRTKVPFNLTTEDLRIPEVCPVLGIPLFFSERGRGDNTPSVDRVNPDLGYVRGNVAVISWRANRMKSRFSRDEFERLVAWLRAFDSRGDSSHGTK